MHSKDDRWEFEQKKAEMSLKLGADSALFENSLNLITELDQYDYSYLWSWMGLPIIQFPADIIATQEVIWKTKPDVIIETGVARGGSLIFMASILCALGRGTVIGIDVDIRKHNRVAVESHQLSKFISLIQGGSTDEETIKMVKSKIKDGDRVMVVLDSDHSRDHVLAECRAYGPLVSKGCYLVVADTLIGFCDETQTPRKRSKIWTKGNEPLAALNDFMLESDKFIVDPELNGKLVLSSSPKGYLLAAKS